MDSILIYTPIFKPKQGGASSYFGNLVGSLESDHNVVVLTTYVSGEPLIESDEQATIYRLSPELRFLPLKIRALISSLLSFILALYLQIGNSFDVVHSHSTSVATPGIALSTSVTRVPLLYDCRDEDFPQTTITWGNVKLWFSCSSNIDYRLCEAGVREAKIQRIPVINPKYVSNYSSNENGGKFSVIFIGSVRKGKGTDIVLETFKQFANSKEDTELTIVGDGPLLNELKEDNKINYNIKFTGSVPHEQALQLLAESDVLVLPSKREGVPRVILEAFEVGIPVIASSRGGITEVVHDKKTGLLTEPVASEVREALNELYQSEQLSKHLSENAKQVVQDREWRVIVERVTESYKEVQY